jgi:hypothetical protein
MSTPVIDPTSQTVYVVAMTQESAGYFYRLHALNLTTGGEQTNSPVSIQASITNQKGAVVTFSAISHTQRAGLVLNGGNVYVGFASQCDQGNWWGWLMSYNASSLNQNAVFNTTPDGSQGGIWMSGGAPAIDSSGSLFFSTGNGTFDDTNDSVPPVPPLNDFGMSFLKLNPTTLAVQDFYTPSQQAGWSNEDLDISAAGVTVLPDGTGPSAHPNILLGADKQGHLWQIDREQMQRFSRTSDNVVQFLALPNLVQCVQSYCLYATPAYWNTNSTVYVAVSDGPLMALPLTNGLFQVTSANVAVPASQSNEVYQYPGPTPVVSASPSGNGIVWVLDNHANGTTLDDPNGVQGPAILRAYDATNLATTLYSSSTLAADAAGPAVKFTLPVVANGHVYVAGVQQLTVYGLAP